MKICKKKIDKKKIINEMTGMISGMSSAGTMAGSAVPIPSYGGEPKNKNKQIKNKYVN